MSEDADTVGFYSMARGNASGARMIYNSLPSERAQRENPCIQFLLGFALEGYFKAYLSYKGQSTKQLKKIGHSLDLGMKTSEQEGLIVQGRAQLRFVVDTLNLGHLRHHYRYLSDKSGNKVFLFVYPDLAFESLGYLDQGVFSAIKNKINMEETNLGLDITTNWTTIPP